MATFLSLVLVFVLALLPFIVFKQRWALGIWAKIKLLLIIYALVIVTAGIVRLVLNWEEIYG